MAYQGIVIDNLRVREKDKLQELLQLGQVTVLKPKSVNFEMSLNFAAISFYKEGKPLEFDFHMEEIKEMDQEGSFRVG